MAWTRSRAELAAALPADVQPAFERLLTVLAGPGSKLRVWGELVEETATRAERLDEQVAQQPASVKAVAEGLRSLDRDLRRLAHQAGLASTLQDNLEARDKALRQVLREPSLWPCGSLSVDETSQHRELLALRDRVLEGERKLQGLTSAIGRGGNNGVSTGGGNGGGIGGADRRPGSAPAAGASGSARSPNVLSLDDDDVYLDGGGGGAGGGGLGGNGGGNGLLLDATEELMRQEEVLHRLVEMMRRARQDSEEAHALARQAVAA